MRRYLLFTTLLLASCTDPGQLYQQQRRAAARLPPMPLIGFNLRLGTPRQRVVQLLDSLRRRNALLVSAEIGLGTLHTSMEPVPVFAADKLVELQLLFPKGFLSKPLIVGVLDSLRTMHGEYGERPIAAISYWYWFSAGTEINFGYSPKLGRWQISYWPVAPVARQYE